MKKLFSLCYIVLAAIYFSATTLAMEPEKYSLVTFIKSQQDRNEFITSIKRISEKYYSGYGQLWDIAKEPRFINFLQRIKTGSLSNVLMYEDLDANKLLLSFDCSEEKLHLHHIDDEEKYCFKNETISTDNLFSLFQKSDGTLIMRNSIDGSLAKISFMWKDCLYGSGIDMPLKEEVLDPLLHQKISVRNDGEMRNRSQLNYGMPKEYCEFLMRNH